MSLYKCGKKKLVLYNNQYNMNGLTHHQSSEHQGIQENSYISQSENAIFRIDLSSRELSYLANCLPKSYSFQIQTRFLKRSISNQKNTKEEIKNVSQLKKKSTKQEGRPNIQKINSNRSNKLNEHYHEEVENVVYEKYSNKEAARRNSYEGVGQNLKPCIKILNLLKNSKTSWPFREPVDPIALGIPHYIQTIKQPMDLSTIQNNLRSNQYITPTQFYADVSKIISNSYKFNHSNQQFIRITQQFENYFKKVTLDPTTEPTRSYSYEDHNQNISKSVTLQAKKSKKSQPRQPTQNLMSTQITLHEKKELSLNIKRLPKEHMKGIVDIVNEGKIKITGEFDLKELQPHIIRKLQTYVKEKLNGQGKLMFGNQKQQNKDRGGEESSSFQLDEDES